MKKTGANQTSLGLRKNYENTTFPNIDTMYVR